MRDRTPRTRAISALTEAGFEVVRKNNDRKHMKLRHADGRLAVIGFNVCDRNLLKSILKQARVEAKL